MSSFDDSHDSSVLKIVTSTGVLKCPFHYLCVICDAGLQEVRLRLTSSHQQTHTQALTDTPSQTAICRKSCLFSWREDPPLVAAGKLDSILSQKPRRGPGHRWQQRIANRCIFQPWFAPCVETLGAMRSRFKGLCVFITWLLLPQVL